MMTIRTTSVNPNSYESVHKVLLDIGKKVGISKYGCGNRQFVIYCDVVPYNLAYRLIHCPYRCSECNTSFLGQIKADEYKQEHGVQITFGLEFDWVLLQPSGGHIEMNMVKAFVELTWEVFWQDMVKLFNFTGEIALHCVKKVTDHPKGWALSCIVTLSEIEHE